MEIKIIFIYVTNPARRVARMVANTLIGKRLIACANIFPIESVYRWKGKVVHEKEWVMIGKTLETHYNSIKKEVEKMHPYDIPCIAKIPAQANKAYKNWVAKEIAKKEQLENS
ncbi:divalent-cation tolerance protein CutA [Candidatus Woesearchaeota archaeon]|nr:divalent-cation tolerance protein CutA [Candidatus Woesearchaeota archaeon]